MSTMLPVNLVLLVNSGPTVLLGALAATFLVLLIIMREALNVYSKTLIRRARALDIVIYPLLVVFAMVVVEHFYRLIFL